ncbi:MAG: type IV secretion system protein [Alphaproteobacteria bacterium]|nr:type IV secretion system protein [Alphaproteobacteria bacterium]
MMNIKAKIFTIIGIVLVFTCNIAHAQNAEKQKIQSQTITEFANTKGGSLKTYVNRLDLDKNTDEEGKSKVIPCGDYTCDKETQKCIKCTEHSYTSDPDGPGMPSGGDTHKCIGKNENASDYNEKFSEWWSPYSSETTCKEVEFGIGDSSYAGFVTIKDGSNCNLQDDSGSKYCLLMKDNEIVLEYADANKSMKGCEVLPVKLYNMRKCFFCPLFSVIFAASEKMPHIAFTKLAAGFATLIALGLAIWIAFQTLTHVSSLTKQDAPKFLAGLIKQSYKFLIAFLLLQYSSQIFQYVVNPVLKSGIDFGGQFLEHNAASGETSEDIQKEINKRAESVPAYGYYIESRKDNNKDLYIKLDGYVSSIQREISFMQAVGSSLICTGNRTLFHKTDKETFASGFKMILQGLVFAIFGFLLSLAFAFYMIDAVVQLGIVGALMPFLIASWPFKVTSQYAGTGFKMLLNSAFIFVFIGLTVEVNMQLINSALANNVSEKQETKASISGDISFGALHDIAVAINEQDSTKLVELTDISTMGFLILIFCCIFGFKFMGQVSSLAGQFSSGGIKPTAPSIATMGASAALSGAKKITKPVREAVGRKAEDAEMAIVGAVAHPIRTAKSIGRGVKSVYNKFRGGSGGGGSGGGGDSDDSDADNIGGGSGGDNGGSGGETKATAKSSAKKKGAVVGQNGSGSKKKGATVGQGGFGGGGSGGSGGNGSTGNNGGGSGGDTEDTNPQIETSDTPEVGIKKNNTKKATSKNQRKYKKSKRRESSQSRKRNRVKARKRK